MPSEVKLNQFRTLVDSLQFPVTREAVIEQVGSTTLRYADGEEQLAAVLERSPVDTYDTVEDLEADVYSNLSIGAVGEPGQSEGEG